MDLHRTRLLIYRMNQTGEKIDTVRLDNDLSQFANAVSVAPVGSDMLVGHLGVDGDPLGRTCSTRSDLCEEGGEGRQVA